MQQHKNAGLDFICFGEAFLQGMEGLCWEYTADKNIAVSVHGTEIAELAAACHTCKTGLSCGYYERDDATGGLYSSNVLIDNTGAIINNYRRVSAGWKEPWVASPMYREGAGFLPFYYQNTKLLIGLCGDFWHEANLKAVRDLAPDLVLWPVAINYTQAQWQNGEREAYVRQVACLDTPVLMVNYYGSTKPGERCLGGAYYYLNGQILHELPLGTQGTLSVFIL